MAHAGKDASPSWGDDVKPYRIRVSSRHLELTRRKLQLTRLPHRVPEPRTTGWWEPQPTAEPLVDFWLDRFSWREQEQELNARVPQFRTAVGVETPVRLHLVHAMSRHARAVPLLLIPPFPFTNLSMAHLITLFTEPAGDDQPFHLVVPSLSGLGFSDALPDKLPVIPSVARMLDVVMKRLGYHHFLVSSSGPSPSALPPVDSRVANHLALHHPDSCLGVHLVSPPLGPPRMRDSVVAWARWKSASILRSPMLGYSREDVEASTNGDGSAPLGTRASSAAVPGFGSGGACEPNILAYALCDSLLATLLFFVMIVRMSGSNRDLPPEDIIKITQLTWLPGPEGTMRLGTVRVWPRGAQGKTGTETKGRHHRLLGRRRPATVDGRLTGAFIERIRMPGLGLPPVSGGGVQPRQRQGRPGFFGTASCHCRGRQETRQSSTRSRRQTQDPSTTAPTRLDSARRPAAGGKRLQRQRRRRPQARRRSTFEGRRKALRQSRAGSRRPVRPEEQRGRSRWVA